MDSQVKYKRYMDHRTKFNTREEEEESRRKKFEPDSDLLTLESQGPAGDHGDQNFIQKFIQDKFDKSKDKASDDEDMVPSEDGSETTEDEEEEKAKDLDALPSLDFKKIL